jgi:hypothetical protein
MQINVSTRAHKGCGAIKRSLNVSNDVVFKTRPVTVEQAVELTLGDFQNEMRWVDICVDQKDALSALRFDIWKINSDLEGLLKLVHNYESARFDLDEKADKKCARLAAKTAKTLSRLTRFAFRQTNTNPMCWDFDDVVYMMPNYRAAIRKIKCQWRALDLKKKNWR